MNTHPDDAGELIHISFLGLYEVHERISLFGLAVGKRWAGRGCREWIRGISI